MARQGKIARLPASLKSEVNRRLFDGQGAPQILPWLNSEPDAIRIWEAYFEGVPASPQNLSEWRLGGHKEWIANNERIEHLKELQSYAVGLVQAGNGKLADGLAAMAAGEIMGALETVGNILVTGGSDDAEKDPLDGLTRITEAIKKLQDGDRKIEDSKRKDATLELNRERHTLNQKQVRLAEEKFQKQTAEMFMDFARKPEIQAILGGGETKAVQMDLLIHALFGADPTAKEASHV